MSAFEPVQLRAGKSRDDLWKSWLSGSNRGKAFTLIHDAANAGYVIHQFRSNDVNLVAVFKRRVFEVWMDRDTEICGERPRRGSPNQNKNISAGERWIDLRRIARERKLYVN